MEGTLMEPGMMLGGTLMLVLSLLAIARDDGRKEWPPR
jgi:hypothetical protein